MSEHELAPALTATEWKEEIAESPDTPLGKRLEWACSEVASDANRGLTPHALAALALYGQPFGFTREMADLVLEAANLHADVAKWMELGWIKAPDDVIAGHLEDENALLEVYDRIAALLPPE